MIPEILAIQEQIGADPELMEALEAVTRLVCPHPIFRFKHHPGDQESWNEATCMTCGERFIDEEIEQELARQAESGGAR